MIHASVFGKTSDGRDVLAFKIKDGANEATILNYGGIIQSLKIANREGKLIDVVLGYDDVASYERNSGYLGALIGRFGNRIDKGYLVVDGEEYQLYCNDRGNHLHGGKVGFDKKIWNYVFEGHDGNTLALSTVSADGEENYPGTLNVKVVYTFSGGVLGIEYTAVSDKTTAINLTNHAYFNLNGAESGTSVLGHELMIAADCITPTDSELIPRGGFRMVKGTPFDFTSPAMIGTGDGMRAQDTDLSYGGGYDHSVHDAEDGLRPYAAGAQAAERDHERIKGRLMCESVRRVWTDVSAAHGGRKHGSETLQDHFFHQSRNPCGRLWILPVHPGLDQADAAGSDKGIIVVKIRRSRHARILKAQKPEFHQFLHAVDKGEISMRAEQRAADQAVGVQIGENILQNRIQSGFVVRCKVFVQNLVEFLKNGVLNLRQHVVDIPVMKVKGATVDIRKVGKLFDGNILDILLLHECHQALKKLSLCFPDAPVRFVLFMNIFFAKILSHKILSPGLFFHQF